MAVSILSIVTLGIYFMYWHAKVFQELRIARDRGPGGGIGFFTAGGIGDWLLPSSIADAYRERGEEPPVTSQTGWWKLLPLVGFFVWVAKCNGALNRLWEARAGRRETPRGIGAAPPHGGPARPAGGPSQGLRDCGA